MGDVNEKQVTVKLEANQLRVARASKEVLHSISFTVNAGEVYALLGGNGAGKSTTLLSFLGFLPPSGGRVQVNGLDVYTHTKEARQSIAYLPESASLYEHLNARENLRYFLRLAGSPTEVSTIEKALDRVLLAPNARDQKLKTYSKGMRQKVAIALAILRDTEILLFDEPTSGLDPSAIDEFQTLIGELAGAQKTILMVSHDVYGACQVADRIGLLRSGQLVGEFSAPHDGRIDTQEVHRAFATTPATAENDTP